MIDARHERDWSINFLRENQPQVHNYNKQYPCITELSYNLQGQSKAEIQIFSWTYPVTDYRHKQTQQCSIKHYLPIKQMRNNNKKMPLPLTTFDYQTALQQYSVSYIANRDFELNPKFANDPKFSLVFINSEVAIFKVKGDVNLAGS